MISAMYTVWTISSRAEQNVAGGVRGVESGNDAEPGCGSQSGAVYMRKHIHKIQQKNAYCESLVVGCKVVIKKDLRALNG